MTGKNWILLLAVSALTVAALVVGRLVGLDADWMNAELQRAGAWAPALFVFCYVVGTSLLLPATPLNLLAGAAFGSLAGALLTSAGALTSAVVNFALARSAGRRGAGDRLAQKWPAIGGELRRGGAWYVFAMRLLPVIPYGVVSYAAGVSPIRFRDYFWSSLPGTVLGILPFVLIGSSGVRVLQRGKRPAAGRVPRRRRDPGAGGEALPAVARLFGGGRRRGLLAVCSWAH